MSAPGTPGAGPGGSPPDSARFKEFPLASLAIRNPTSVMVLLVIIVVMGINAYTTIPKESQPAITIPNIIVNTIYPGASPDDVENLVTRKIEKELATIGDVKVMTSQSIEGYSSINVEFQAGTNMDEALRKVREKVDRARLELPSDAEEPGVYEINISEFPIMQVNIAGDYSQVRLKKIAEDLKEQIESIPQVLEVNLSGGVEREVQIHVDLPRLTYYDLTFSDVVDAIQAENVTIPGGSIEVGSLKYMVRVPGELSDTELIGGMVVTAPGDRPIYVRDVAEVDFGFKESSTYARMDGSPVVSLSVSKRVGENIIETAEQVRAEIEAMRGSFPPTTRVTITGDQSEYIRDMVSNLENNIISGLILVVAVLLFFLGLRNALFVGAAIPLSMLLSFIVLKLAGMTMNMIVLFSLILALGMLVDNAIVVVENIYRFMEEGFDRVTASRKATGEVAVPIIAATATTIAAFAPLAFWPGIVGEFMGYLPKTLIITLSSSLFVGLVINPTLCSLFMRLEHAPHRSLPRRARLLIAGTTALLLLVTGFGHPLVAGLLLLTAVVIWAGHRLLFAPLGRRFLDRGLPWLQHHYEVSLRWALQHRPATLLMVLLSFVGSFVLFGMFNRGVEFFPERIPPSDLYVQLEAPDGTRLDFTDRLTRRIETEVNTLPGQADFKSVVATVGYQQGTWGRGASDNLATVAINLVDYPDRRYDAFQTLEDVRAIVGPNLAGADVAVQKPDMGPPTGRPINIEISGPSATMLASLGDRILELIESAAVGRKLDGLESDLARGRPELVVDVDRERAAMFGLSTQVVGYEVRSAINGVEASTFRDGEDEYDVIVRLARSYREDLDALGDLSITRDGRRIPLSSVATWHVGEGFGGINRKDQKRVVTVSSEVRSGYQANAVLGEVQALLAGFVLELPPGYTLSYTGQQQEQGEAEAFLSQAFLIALFLIAFILISQFNSVTKPLLILFNVLLSIVGVLTGLVLFGMPFGIIMTGVGIISLAGIVVNNGIVLIDYVDTLRIRDGIERGEALVRGGLTRLRPVLLTAITTVLGLVPLAIGLNLDFLGLYTALRPDLYWGGEQAAWWGPMAIAVISGLTFATLLTLILTPVMYSLVEDLNDWFHRVLLGR